MHAYLLVGAEHLWTFFEEASGAMRRLVGEPWDDDGALPLVMTVAGRERYIGTAAAVVAYASPGCKLVHPLDPIWTVDEGVDHAAIFLRTLFEVLERRAPQSVPITWRLGVHAAGSRAAATLATAWRLTGRPLLGMVRMADIVYAQSEDAIRATSSVRSRTCARFDAAGATAALLTRQAGNDDRAAQEDACGAAPGDAKSWHLQDEDHCKLGQLACESWTAKGMYRTAWRTRRATGDVPPEVVAWPREGRWILEPAAAVNSESGERAHWQALARLIDTVDSSCTAESPPERLVLESLHRTGAWQAGRECLAKEFVPEGRLVPLESQAQLFASGPTQIPHSLVLILQPTGDDPWDHKIVAPEGADLPFESEHIVMVRAGRRTVSFELHALEGPSGRGYRLVTDTLALPAETRSRTAVHLRVDCHASGLVEIEFSVPSWRFHETVLVDPVGRLHRRVAQRAMQTQGA